MFCHIPVDILRPQINRNIDEALQVLDARLRNRKCMSRSFDWEFRSLDPENPITQISKTPSDEELPCDWESDILEEEKYTGKFVETTPRSPQRSKINLQEPIKDMNPDMPVKQDKTPEEGEKKEVPKDPTADVKTGKNIASLMRSNRSKTLIKPKLLVNDVAKFIEEMREKITQDNLQVRVIPSHSSCRFELPIDMTRLANMTPIQYLSKYCRVQDSRKVMYESQFQKYLKEREKDDLFLSDTRKIYEELFHEESLADEMLHLKRMLDMDITKELNLELFTVISCLMERIIVKSKGWTPHQDAQRNVFEAANFCSLNGKMHGTEVKPSLRNLLEFIRSA